MICFSLFNHGTEPRKKDLSGVSSKNVATRAVSCWAPLPVVHQAGWFPIREVEPGLPFLFLKSLCHLTPTNPLPKEQAWKKSFSSGITAKFNAYPQVWTKIIITATLSHCFSLLSSKDIPRILWWMQKGFFHHQLSNVNRLVECNSCSCSVGGCRGDPRKG